MDKQAAKKGILESNQERVQPSLKKSLSEFPVFLLQPDGLLQFGVCVSRERETIPCSKVSRPPAIKGEGVSYNVFASLAS